MRRAREDRRRPSGHARYLLVVSSLASVGGCADDGGPRLDRADPASARSGATVTLYGTRLCGGGACAAAAGEIQIGLSLPTIKAPVLSYEDGVAQIVVPVLAPIGATSIVVTVNEHASNALAFEVLP